MSATSAPFGLRPSHHNSGLIRPVAGVIITAYGTSIYQGAPVKIGTSGGIELAAAGDRSVGSFQGVEYTDSEGRRRVSNRWVASTAGTDIIAYYTRDPGIVYEIQANAALAVGDIGKQYDWNTATSGDSTTGLSTVALDVASSAANAGLQLLGAAPGPDNALTDTYPIVQVRISEHQLAADVAAF